MSTSPGSKGSRLAVAALSVLGLLGPVGCVTTTEATATLARDADCLKQVGRVAQLVGHADPRGTQEYNLALSERRAQSVRDHLGRLGVDGGKMTVLPRGSLDAKGTDEPSWAQDRRVDFTWR